MKITFEGDSVFEIANQMALFMANMGLGIAGQLDRDEKPYSTEVEDDEILQNAAGTGEPENETSEQASLKPDPEKSPRQEETEEPSVPEEAPQIDNDAAKKQAIDVLMELYNDGKADEVKALLGKFGVKKFSEVPVENGNELLSAAEDLQKEPA